MANLKRIKVDDKEKTTQTITLSGNLRNALVEEAIENDRSLSYVIMNRLKKSLIQDGIGV